MQASARFFLVERTTVYWVWILLVLDEDESDSLSRHSPMSRFAELVRDCLEELYNKDENILRRNDGNGICERSIVFRFAHYLQQKFEGRYFVDCDFNSSFEGRFGPDGRWSFRDVHGKPIGDPDGKVTNRFVDIIVHKRDRDLENDLICFEVKKWNNRNSRDFAKDENNLRYLTSRYGYAYGFHVTIHRIKSKSTWTIFHEGKPIRMGEMIFPDS